MATGGDPRLAAILNERGRQELTSRNRSTVDFAIQGLWVGEKTLAGKQTEFYLVQPQCPGALPIRSVAIDLNIAASGRKVDAIQVFSYGRNISEHLMAQPSPANLHDTSAANVADVLDRARGLPLCEGYWDSGLDKNVFDEKTFASLIDGRGRNKATILATPFPFPFISASQDHNGVRVAGTYRALGCTRIAATLGSSRCDACSNFAATMGQRTARKSSMFPVINRFCFFRFLSESSRKYKCIAPSIILEFINLGCANIYSCHNSLISTVPTLLRQQRRA